MLASATNVRDMSEEREILGWEQFGEASRELARMVADDGYEPEMILSVREVACASEVRSVTPLR